MPDIDFPDAVGELTPEILTAVVGARFPGAEVKALRVVGATRYGDGLVSTADRIVLDLVYGEGAPLGLPSRIVIKTMIETPHAPACLYENEVRFYAQIRPELKLEAPFTLGATFNPLTGHFAVLLEDLTRRGARLPNVTRDVTVRQVEALLDTVATLHAAFWRSPRFHSDLSWVQSHVRGSLCTFFDGCALELVDTELKNSPFKVDLVKRIGRSTAQLWADTKAVQRHQSRLPPTLLHGDTHIGNTYLLPDGTGGLLDWQLMVRGSWVHDVNYLIATALPTDLRRLHEKALLARYLDSLARGGVTDPPLFEDAWREYRRAIVWGIFIGWLTVPVANYGFDIINTNLDRLISASEDLESFRLIDGA